MNGIEWLELYIPETFVCQQELAAFHGVDPNKYLIGLGQKKLSFCNDREDAISMCMTVVKRVFEKYDPKMFGFFGVGTESILDHSKSIKSYLLDMFNGAVPPFGLDTHNACYGGTASLLQALAWLDSGFWTGEQPLALVVCTDIASYKHNHQKCTGGAGAVAIVLSKDPKIQIGNSMVHHMEHVFDFYKPLRTEEYPIVNGPLSLKYFLQGLSTTYMKMKQLGPDLNKINFFLMHTPYTKLVSKGFKKICALEQIKNEEEVDQLFAAKVAPGCELASIIGNIYTGSVYLALISLLLSKQETSNKSALLYSYGSGYLCSMLKLYLTNDAVNVIDCDQITAMLTNRRKATVDEYNLAEQQRLYSYNQLSTIPLGKVPESCKLFVLDEVKNGKRFYVERSKWEKKPPIPLPIHKLVKRSIEHGSKLPYRLYDWPLVINRCCENIIGYTKVPVGLAGPVFINERKHYIPLATTEGALVASVDRGCKLLRKATIFEIMLDDVGMSRAPVFEFNTIYELHEFIAWAEQGLDDLIVKCMAKTSAKGRLTLKETELKPFGRKVYLRLSCSTQNAMGMNMMSNLTQNLLGELKVLFPNLKIISNSSNYCTDKKNSACNWILGRGKRCHLYCSIPENAVLKILQVSARDLVKAHLAKNFLGSSLAGTIGGHNAQIANIIAGIYLATGQDLGQIGTSAAGLINYEVNNSELEVSLYMPNIECGTVGGGTHLPTQKEGLRLARIDDAYQLAKLIICAACAGEISLLGALAAKQHMKAHNKLNKYSRT
jgi:NADP-dependent 3-hydroxy-3-methylglutaryl-CoA reductase